MLSIDDALRIVFEHAAPLPSRRVPLRQALGCGLTEEVRADQDSPPFHKALLDGFAVRSEDFQGPGPEYRLELIEEITAGQTPQKPIGPGQTTAITTGSPMPDGADAVAMVEDSRREGSTVIVSPKKPIVPNTGRLERGQEMNRDEVLLRPGTRLDPVKLGLLAAVGWAEPQVVPKPRVAIASTGDEIVPPERQPGPGQIRNSNATVLDALARSSGAEAEPLPIAPDDTEQLRSVLGQGLQADVLLITGGVSAGKRDLVPGVLERLGVEPKFHKVRLKPGKPLLFGIGPRGGGDQPRTLVFGLPGNPVSGVVGFLLFVKPALARLMGHDPAPTPTLQGPLVRPFAQRGDRPTYYPSRQIADNAGGFRIEPLDWAGSADLRTVAMADGFAVFEAGHRQYNPGDLVPFLPLPTAD